MTAMTVALLLTVALAVSVLIGLIVLVSIASRREDAEWTLSGPIRPHPGHRTADLGFLRRAKAGITEETREQLEAYARRCASSSRRAPTCRQS
jgi:hypothetical protein